MIPSLFLALCLLAFNACEGDREEPTRPPTESSESVAQRGKKEPWQWPCARAKSGGFLIHSGTLKPRTVPLFEDFLEMPEGKRLLEDCGVEVHGKDLTFHHPMTLAFPQFTKHQELIFHTRGNTLVLFGQSTAGLSIDTAAPNGDSGSVMLIGNSERGEIDELGEFVQKAYEGSDLGY